MSKKNINSYSNVHCLLFHHDEPSDRTVVTSQYERPCCRNTQPRDGGSRSWRRVFAFIVLRLLMRPRKSPSVVKFSKRFTLTATAATCLFAHPFAHFVVQCTRLFLSTLALLLFLFAYAPYLGMSIASVWGPRKMCLPDFLSTLFLSVRTSFEQRAIIQCMCERISQSSGMMPLFEALILRCSNQFDQSVVEVSKVVTR